MTITEIREALTEVRDAVEVPPADRVAFQRRVRAERRRRTSARVLVAGAAAAAVVVAGVALAGIGNGDERRVDPGPADRAATAGEVSETVYFVLDGRLTALDPVGVVHDLDVAAEAVVGWTSERVYAVDDESRLLVRTVTHDEGSGRATFGSAPSPVSGPVQTMVLSGDGRYLGWTDLDDVAHRYDLKAEREDLTLPGLAGASVIGVGADGLLLYSADGLTVRDADSGVQVPVAEEWGGASAQLAFGRVLVGDRDGTSRLYDLADAEEPVAELAGFGVLGPYAERVAVLDENRLEVWDGGPVEPVTGLDATPDQVRWADETTLLVAAHDADGAGLWACDIELACDRLPVAGEVNLNR